MSIDNLINAWPVWVGLLVIAAIIAVVMILRRRKRAHLEFQVQRKSRIFSAAEKTFYDTVKENLGDEFYVLANVAFMDVLEPDRSLKDSDSKVLKKIHADRFFDYVICSKEDLSIFGVIELENFDKNPDAKERKARESLIENMCKLANLRLFYFDIRQDYQEVDLYRLVTGRMRKKPRNPEEPIEKPSTHESQLAIEAEPEKELKYLKECPKCYSDLVTKVAIKGSSIGEKFLMCRKYPYCDYQIPAEEARQSLSKRKPKKQQAGFKDWA